MRIEAFDGRATAAMTGITFTGCDVLAAASARAQSMARGAARTQRAERRPKTLASRRREVVVGGRRVKTIDVHAHCVIPAAYALLGLKVEDHRGPGIGEIGRAHV